MDRIIENEGEIWRPVQNYEGLYEVSNQGRVKSLNYNHTGREGCLKLCKSNDLGHLKVGLSKNNKTRHFWVHRLVAQAFIENPENKPEVDHINTIPDDNRVENLRWTTPSENCNNELTLKHNSEAQKIVMSDPEYRAMIGRKVSAATMGHPVSDETRRKISEAKTGKAFSEEHKQHMSEARKGKYMGSESACALAVIQYTLEGEKVREWGSIVDAGKTLGIERRNISSVCKGKRHKCGGFKWAYA